jgi:hypothetical protein
MNTENTMATLLGGEVMTLNKKDGSTEELKVLQIAVEDYPTYLKCQEDECAMVDMLCGKPSGFFKELTPESFEAVVIKGEAINQDFFGRWAQRKLARQERLFPGVTDRILKSAALNPQSSNSPISAK